MSAEDDGRIFNPRECDNCTGGGCTLCHGDGEFWVSSGFGQGRGQSRTVGALP